MNQNPIRYDARPTFQKKKRRRKLSAKTSIGVENEEGKVSEEAGKTRSPAIYPLEQTWTRNPTLVTTIGMTAVNWSTKRLIPIWKLPDWIQV